MNQSAPRTLGSLLPPEPALTKPCRRSVRSRPRSVTRAIPYACRKAPRARHGPTNRLSGTFACLHKPPLSLEPPLTIPRPRARASADRFSGVPF